MTGDCTNISKKIKIFTNLTFKGEYFSFSLKSFLEIKFIINNINITIICDS